MLPLSEDATAVTGTQEIKAHKNEHEDHQQIGEVEGGIIRHPGLVDDGADRIDEAGKEGVTHRIFIEAAQGAEGFREGETPQLHAPDPDNNQGNAAQTTAGNHFPEEKGAPDRHIQHRRLRQGVNKGKIAAAVGLTIGDVIKDKTEAPAGGEGEDARRRQGEGAGEKREERRKDRRRDKEHPPDVDRLVAAALDEQIPQGMHQGRKEDKREGQSTHGAEST